jgi:hypothetical protein
MGHKAIPIIERITIMHNMLSDHDIINLEINNKMIPRDSDSMS